MYRGSSPIFDVPEFPTLRRVKPLPKRRRTSDSPSQNDSAASPTGTAFGLSGIELPGPDATAEELLAHADTLSAHMALQSYYIPILNGAQDLFSNLNEMDNRTTVSFGGAMYGAGEGRGGGGGDDDHGDGDYIDHLQQPGNTKKRKVPANASASSRGHDAGSGQSGAEDESMDKSIPTGRTDHDTVEIFQSPSPTGALGQRKGKITPATLAGLQHKEMLKSRKRQLAAVLGALSHGDTLALDQALSANYPFANNGQDDIKALQPPKVRLSRRRAPRLARATRVKALPLHPPDADAFPDRGFAFICPSATSDRLIATKEEVAMLRGRFEAELARQAAKAAKLAAANKLIALLPQKGARSKRAERATRTSGGGKGGEQTAEFLDQSLGMKARGKKKKRSALANASNPHHLRNYVPSRLPHSQTNLAQTNMNTQNSLGPLPLRFLSAEIPPRRRKKTQAVMPLAQLSNPVDEWICPFCEYELFYGDEQDYRRAVRMRKKILKRRRRARERAAAAASGNSIAKGPEKGSANEEEYDVGFEGIPDSVTTIPKPTKGMKGEKGGGQGTFG